LLRACARIDRLAKGAEAGSPWDALLASGLRLAGLEWFDRSGSIRRSK